MVFYFDCCDDQYIIYMGKDKHENEELLKFGFPEDVRIVFFCLFGDLDLVPCGRFIECACVSSASDRSVDG